MQAMGTNPWRTKCAVWIVMANKGNPATPHERRIIKLDWLIAMAGIFFGAIFGPTIFRPNFTAGVAFGAIVGGLIGWAIGELLRRKSRI